MIDGSEKRNRQLAFELQNSRQHAHEYRYYKTLVQHGLAVPSTKSSVSVVCIMLYATEEKTIEINISVQS